MSAPMPYFFIIPLWLLAVAVMTVATAATRFSRSLIPAFPFAWRILAWSSAGFVGANALVIALYAAVGRLGEVFPNGPPAVNLVAAAVLFGAPFLASGVGFLVGAALGAWFALRARAA